MAGEVQLTALASSLKQTTAPNREVQMIPNEMKVIDIKEFGAPDMLIPAMRDVPVPGPTEVLVKVTAVGVNGPDIIQRKGFYPPPKGASDLLGLEVSGEIVALGVEVVNWSVGDKICALTNGGGYAQYVAVEQSHCLPIPQGVSEIDAAGLVETFFTVWSNVFMDHDIKPGSLLLVHGGAGGIGTAALQLGVALGLRVFVTAGSAENCAFCQELGAERAINYRDEDFVEIVRAVGGADIILDIIGGDYIARNFKTANPDAHVIQLAFNKGSKVEINLMPVMLKRLIYRGSTLRSRPSAFKTRLTADVVQHIWPLFAANTLRTITHAVLSFDEASAAHTMMEQGGHRGKIILTL